jgi:endonuclease/exonuclease/phosphatase family metal-dependent hydrolase
MTYTIRYNNPDDGLNAWPNRKENVIALIKKHHPDLLGIQEGLKDQVDDLSDDLNDYRWFGVGRDDGRDSGEFAAIFYSKDRFEFLDGSTFWLSETPDIPGSRGWDAACNRIVTWIKVKDKKTGQILFHFNTHFDYKGQISQRESAKLLIKKIHEIAGKLPVVATGDFNVNDSTVAYKIITMDRVSSRLTNSREKAIKLQGPDYTYIGFEFVGKSGDIIDHIFFRGNFIVSDYEIITDNKDGVYPSDHLPVMVIFGIPSASGGWNPNK